MVLAKSISTPSRVETFPPPLLRFKKKMVLAKPISSPSRVETFPPPLLRFLRSNGGSKSRGRCRSSPIFIQKKKSGRNQAIVTQEPSSPKVTCMGQVRIRRSKQAGKKNMKKKKKKKKNIIDRNGYQWIQKTLFCCNFNEKLKPKTNTSNKPYWGRWVLPNFRRKSKIQEESTKREDKIEDFEETTEEEEDEKEKVGVFIASSPPKNALLLMRCRSEPYRASSLANQFWGSPSLTNQQQLEEEERECKTEQKHIEDEEEEEEEEEEKPTLGKEPNCRDSATESITDPETEEKMGFYQGFERSSSTTSTKTCSKIEAETSKIPSSSSSSRPLLLTRCKSEPATRSEKIQVETCFWKKRLEFV